jgi:hypothetical protein
MKYMGVILGALGISIGALINIGCNPVRDQICELPILGIAGAQPAPARYFPKEIPKDYGPRANECAERRASGVLEGIGAKVIGNEVVLTWSVPVENTGNLPATASAQVSIRSPYPAQEKPNRFVDQGSALIMPHKTRLIAGEIKIPLRYFETKYLSMEHPENWFDRIDSQISWSGIMVSGPDASLEFIWAGDDPDGFVRLRWISRMVSVTHRLIATCESPPGVARPQATASMDTGRINISVTCVLVDADGKEIASDRAEIPGTAGPAEAAGWFRIPKEKALAIAWNRCRADWVRRLDLIPGQSSEPKK